METAEAMAKGIQNLDHSEFSVATTGIAGPSGGTKEKPVGLVYIAVTGPGSLKVETYNFVGRRADIQRRTAHAALALLRDVIITKREH